MIAYFGLAFKPDILMIYEKTQHCVVQSLIEQDYNVIAVEPNVSNGFVYNIKLFGINTVLKKIRFSI